MTVETDQKKYDFALVASDDLDAPYLVRFRNTDTKAATPPPLATELRAVGELTGYKVRGDKSLRPQSINDDGSRTFITWSADQPIPAVFAINRLGSEAMVDGYMRNSVFTIDHVHQQLVFRIDNATATASRLPRKGKK